MINVEGVPVQPNAEGITVIVDDTGELPALVAAKPGISPLPLLPKPIAVELFDQL